MKYYSQVDDTVTTILKCILYYLKLRIKYFMEMYENKYKPNKLIESIFGHKHKTIIFYLFFN